MNVDPAKMRALATSVRMNAGRITTKTPIAKVSRDLARERMAGSNLAVKVEESLKAMDTVLAYHNRRLSSFCDSVDTAAGVYEQTDADWAAQLKQLGG
ncbi:type VII secretion target [Nocardia pseudovaccinii]|uniref:type VII secretion target n=1 Tax=Nocardia pseudovaccinii TaxID=189540 RepID=UPI0007A416CC|nr:type VII secretion target [Nocardia pseudovaccinii]